MYRSDLDAAQARAQALERELEAMRQARRADQLKVLDLQQRLARRQLIAPSDLPRSRGDTVLTWGVLSLLLCLFLGPIAWSLGNDELRKIDAGRVSPDGRSAAAAGRVLGIISTLLLLIAIIAIIVLVATTPSHR